MASIMCLGSGLSCAYGVWLLLGRQNSSFVGTARGHRPIERYLEVLSRVSYRVHVPEAFGKNPYVALVSQELRNLCVQQGVYVATAAMPLVALCAILLVGFAGWFIASSLLGFAVGIVIGVAILYLWAAYVARRRARFMAEQVPDIYRSLASALGSGRTLAQAISYVASTGKTPLHCEFARASLSVSCGVSAIDALSELPKRIQAPGIDLMVTALSISARTGAPLQDLFGRTAQLVERHFELERELSAKTAQVRLSARLVTLLPAALVCLLVLVSPDFREGLSTDVGTGCICAAIALDACALFIIRGLMRGVV